MNGIDVSISESCLEAIGSDHGGYPRWTFFGKTVSASRISYVLAHGKIPDGYHVHHTCHNRKCVNPSHLVALSPSEHESLHQAEGLCGVAKEHADREYCKVCGSALAKGKRQRFCKECAKRRCREWASKKRLNMPAEEHEALLEYRRRLYAAKMSDPDYRAEVNRKQRERRHRNGISNNYRKRRSLQ